MRERSLFSGSPITLIIIIIIISIIIIIIIIIIPIATAYYYCQLIAGQRSLVRRGEQSSNIGMINIYWRTILCCLEYLMAGGGGVIAVVAE